MKSRPGSAASPLETSGFVATALRPRTVAAWVALLLLLTLWEHAGPGLNPASFSYPSAIAKAFYELAVSGELWEYASQSLGALALGLVLASAAGLALGVVFARVKGVDKSFEALLGAMSAIPMVVLVPLVVGWAQWQREAAVLVVFLCGVFPILARTYRGLTGTDPALIDVARSFHRSSLNEWRDVRVRAAVPEFMVGLRVAFARSLAGLVIVELYTALSGFGAMIVRYANLARMDCTLVPVLAIVFIAVSLTAALRNLERRISPWQSAA